MASEDLKNIDDLYEEVADWHVNTGGQKVVSKRMGGKYRNLKWMGMTVWLAFFLGPYLRWNGQQAFLFDIQNRQFHFFELTLYPQDIWMLSLTLLFFAILLAAVTSVAGRVFCGYFCFQTVWTDIFTLIESKLEGDTPQKARKFKEAPWDMNKTGRKLFKHAVWIAIGIVTGITFTNWFTDAYQNWVNIFTLQPPIYVVAAMVVFGGFTYGFAGFMREQVCFWLCPYARLQSVMYDQDTILPAYDAERGEPRGRRKKGDDSPKGSCVDCKVCVAVCPTGIDIRQGQQEGCITCGMCIDACDSIMEKVNQPKGLIRYASYKELHHNKEQVPLFKRPRVLVYSTILMACMSGIVYGFTNLSPTEFKVIHDRQPVFTMLSDGSVQNKYTLKLLNKTQEPIHVSYSVSGIEGMSLHGMEEQQVLAPGKSIPLTALVRVPDGVMDGEVLPIEFTATVADKPGLQIHYESMFIGPK